MPPSTPITLDSSSGKYQARIFPDTGRIALAGPGLSGTPLAAVTTLEPIEVKLSTGTTFLGRVDGVPRIAGGTLEVDLDHGGAKATARITFPVDGVLRFEVISWGGPTPTSATISAMSDASEHFFGLGERFNALDQIGRRVDVKTNDHPGPKFDAHDRTKPDFAYKVVPWFLSSRGYGFHLDSSVESVFDLRQTHPDRFVVLQPFIPDRPGGLAFHLVAGPKLTDALSRYTALAGRPPLPPPLGVWAVDLVRRLAQWWRGALRRREISPAQDPCLGVRLRLAVGDGLQRSHVQPQGRPRARPFGPVRQGWRVRGPARSSDPGLRGLQDVR